MAALVEMRLQQAHAERLAPLDFLSTSPTSPTPDRLLEHAYVVTCGPKS